MIPTDSRDQISTVAGGGAGMAILLTVRWELVPYGEAIKIAVAMLLVALGYLMYRPNPKPPEGV